MLFVEVLFCVFFLFCSLWSRRRSSVDSFARREEGKGLKRPAAGLTRKSCGLFGDRERKRELSWASARMEGE